MSDSQPGPTPRPSAPISGVLALVLGIAAFLLWWLPFLGVLLGAAAVVLAILVLRRDQSRGLGIAACVLGGVATLSAIIATLVFLVAVLSPEEGGTSTQAGTGGGVAQGEIRRSPSTGAEEQAQYEARRLEKQEAERAAREAEERKKGVVLPDLTGLDGKAAQWKLEDLGLRVRFDAKQGVVMVPATWTVLGSAPAAGERVQPGGTVVLRVEYGTRLRSTPNPR